MSASLFTVEALSDAGYSDLTPNDLPPFAEFLPGTTGSHQVHLAGPEGGPGQISGLQFATGGFRYTDLPITESAFLLQGVVRVSDATTGDEFVVGAGQGFVIPTGWSGTVEALEPVTKVFHVL